MKRMLILSSLLIFVACGSKSHPSFSKITTIKLTHDQMIADFDQMTNILLNAIPKLKINEKIFNIPIEQALISNRQKIVEGMSAIEFVKLINRSLMIVQDEHGGLVNKYRWMNNNRYFWSSQIRALNRHISKFSIATTVKYKRRIKSRLLNIELPLFYSYLDGHYYTFHKFKHENMTIPQGARLVSINDQDVNQQINRLDEYRWLNKDFQRGILYYSKFYKYPLFYQSGTYKNQLKCSFIIPGTKIIRDIYLNQSDQIYFPSNRKLNSKKKKIFLLNDHTLYIRLPKMYHTKQEMKYYFKYLNEIKHHDLTRVIIDIRDNWGGSDLAWIRLLKMIIDKPLIYRDQLAMLDSPLTRDYLHAYHFKKDANHILTNIPYISTHPLIVRNLTYRIRPNFNTIHFSGPIYVLVDGEVYSSAGLFAAQCKYNSQLISVGSQTYHGGAGMGPWVFTLSNSQLSLRLSQYADLCEIKTIKDIYHSTPEMMIPISKNEELYYYQYEGDVYSKRFLKDFDPLVRYILTNKWAVPKTFL